MPITFVEQIKAIANTMRLRHQSMSYRPAIANTLFAFLGNIKPMHKAKHLDICVNQETSEERARYSKK